jgi:hypothetical protein
VFRVETIDRVMMFMVTMVAIVNMVAMRRRSS